MTRRRRTVSFVLAFGLLALAASVLAAWFPPREPVGQPKSKLPHAMEGGQEPISGQFVGHPESSVAEQFGAPTSRWEGHYGSPPIKYQRIYRDAVTVTYTRPTGTHYLSYCRERGTWVCFGSNWMPVGYVF